MTVPAPPGWYPDPAAGRMRWWDGVSWHDPPPGPATASDALPFGSPPIPTPPRRSRTPWIVAGVLGVVLLLAIILVVPLLFAPPTWRDEAEQVQGALLVPADLGADWTEVDASTAGTNDPFTEALAADPRGALVTCPDGRDAFAAGSDRMREIGESGDAFGDQAYLGRSAERKGVRQTVVTFHTAKDAEEYVRTIRGWLTCTATWEVVGEDGWRFQISSGPVDAQPFGADVIAGKLRVEPVEVGDLPEDLPDDLDPTQPVEFTYVARIDGRSVVLIGMSGMADDEVIEVWRTADDKMFGD